MSFNYGYADKERPRRMKARVAYCQARARRPLSALLAAHEKLGGWIERHAKDTWRW